MTRRVSVGGAAAVSAGGSAAVSAGAWRRGAAEGVGLCGVGRPSRHIRQRKVEREEKKKER